MPKFAIGQQILFQEEPGSTGQWWIGVIDDYDSKSNKLIYYYGYY